MASFECTKCVKSYKNQSSLKEHQRMHDGTAFACELCEKQFNQKNKLERHHIAHTFLKPYACDVDGCEKKFTTPSHVRTHKHTVHEKVPGKHRCSQCLHRTFAHQNELQIHRRIHTGEQPYACTECPKKFKQKGQLQVHYRMKHTRERPYACELCDKRTSTKAEIEHHRTTHTFAKPFACDAEGCEKKFAAKSSVLQHKRRVHEKVSGKYRCEQCTDRSFAHLDDLKAHIRIIHTSERSYPCSQCAKVHMRKRGLENHFRSVHTTERPYACAHCHETFATLSRRFRHQRNAHKFMFATF